MNKPSPLLRKLKALERKLNKENQRQIAMLRGSSHKRKTASVSGEL